MAKRKLLRYEQVSKLPNTYQIPNFMQPDVLDGKGEKVEIKGNWHRHFGNNNPITLELGCGRGEYTIDLARRYPNRNFIGIDLKGNRLWMGASTAINEGLHNAAFARAPIEHIRQLFAEGEVAEIWVTFADPQPFKPRKRLTSARFLELYRPLLAKEHLLHLKTDSSVLYESTVEVVPEVKGTILYQNDDIYSAPLAFPELECQTNYEKIHRALGKTIKYLRFVM